MNNNINVVSFPSRRARLSGLTGLRGVAAIWVLLFHIYQQSEIPVIEHGYVGVDIFFILSGFVLSHVYMQEERFVSFKFYMIFLGVRLARIFPLHIFTLFALLLIVTTFPDFMTSYNQSVDRFGDGAFIANLLLIQNWGFWFPGNWNWPSWSLSAEWFAYLCFPFLLVMIRRISSPALLVGLAVLVLCILIGVLYMAGHRTTDVQGLAGMARMAGEFSAGTLLYAAFARGWRVATGPALVLLSGMLAVGLLLPHTSLIMVLAAALMVFLAAQGQNGCARVLEWRPIVFIGEISYSVYLVHWIILQLLLWSSRQGVGLGGPLAIQCTTIAVAMVVAFATYRCIELPARTWGRRLALASAGPATRHLPRSASNHA